MVNDSTRKISDKIFKREEFGLPKNDFIFYCFNSYYKLTPNIFDIWMRLLKNVKNSVLWLPQGNLVLIKNLKNEASKRHIDPNRLIFAKRMSSIADHLSRHRMADLFIDTFPYGAHSTCADALWAGVPVITLAGESFASKVSASLLNAIGLSELITNTEKEYEDLAVELATNPARLKEIRKKLEN